jgi:hypothetical protein
MVCIEDNGSHHSGKIAALNMLGKQVPVMNVPFFWTTQYGKSIRYRFFQQVLRIRYCGHALQTDDFYIEGKMDDLNFLIIFAHKGKVLAAAGILVN